jgi:hypothetical protein
LEELRLHGGPTFDALRHALDAALEQPDTFRSLGVLFASLAASLKRPVEILGLLQLATDRSDLARTGDDERYVAVRPDGSQRHLAVPRLVPTAASGPAAESVVVDAAQPASVETFTAASDDGSQTTKSNQERSLELRHDTQ